MVSSIGSQSQMMSQLFSRLDSKSQGYLEKSDLTSAFSAIGSGDETSVDDIFAALDVDSDGKVTESEFSTALSRMQEELDGQFHRSRMRGGMEGMGGMPPPPPPPEDDTGFTQDELSAQLEEIGDTDSRRSELLTRIVDNFDEADADGDGKVSFAEARAFDEAQGGGSSASSAAGTASADDETRVMMKIMQLMQAYSPLGGDQDSSSTLFATA